MTHLTPLEVEVLHPQPESFHQVQLFTSADNYVIALTQEPKPSEAILLLAAGLAVDTVYKES